MGAFMDIVFWGMFVFIGIACYLVLSMISKLHVMKDDCDYFRSNSIYFTEVNVEKTKEIDNLQQDISYYLNRLALYKAFLAENDMVEKFIHWRPTITVNNQSVPPWEDEIDEVMNPSIRLPDRSSGS